MSQCGVRTCKNFSSETPPQNVIIIQILPQKKLIAALIDTGASCSVIDLKLVKRMKLQIRPLEQKMKILAANESTLKQVGTVSAKVGMIDYLAECDFIVVDKLFYPVIIGMDILKQHNFLINLNENYIQVGPSRTTLPLAQYINRSQLARLDANI